MNNYKIGEFILLKRKEANLTQKELAEKIGVSDKTISKWECGKCMPDYSVIDSLCETLNITPSQLINGTSEKSCLTNEETKNFMKIFNTLDILNKVLVSILFIVFSIPFLIIFQIIHNKTFKFYFDYSKDNLFDGTMLLVIFVIFFIIGIIGIIKLMIDLKDNKKTRI